MRQPEGRDSGLTVQQEQEPVSQGCGDAELGVRTEDASDPLKEMWHDGILLERARLQNCRRKRNFCYFATLFVAFIMVIRKLI